MCLPSSGGSWYDRAVRLGLTTRWVEHNNDARSSAVPATDPPHWMLTCKVPCKVCDSRSVLLTRIGSRSVSVPSRMEPYRVKTPSYLKCSFFSLWMSLNLPPYSTRCCSTHRCFGLVQATEVAVTDWIKQIILCPAFSRIWTR